MKSSLCLTIVLILMVGATSENSGVVRGEILDASSGEAIPGSRLTLIPEKVLPGVGEIVTRTGKFTIDGVPAGKYRAIVSHPEYRTLVSEQFYVRANEITELNFWLRLYLTRVDSLSILRPGTPGVDYKMRIVKPPPENAR